MFAHNGDLDGIEQNERFSLSRFLPIGETDSEHAFCYLMGLMQPLWQDGTVPSLMIGLPLLATSQTDPTLGTGKLRLLR